MRRDSQVRQVDSRGRDDSRVLDCGHTPSPHGEHTTGTARTRDNREVCWDCAIREEQEAFRTADKYVAYLSSDLRKVTTWTGGLLADVVGWRRVQHGFCGELYHFKAVAPDGSWWLGTSQGGGMCARLRRGKVRRA